MKPGPHPTGPCRAACAWVASCAMLLLSSTASALTLADAIDAALQWHEDIDLAELDVVLAEAGVRETRAGLLPSLSISAQVVRNDAGVELGGSSFTRLWDSSATGAASVRLLDVSNFAALRAARRRAESASLDAADVSAQLRSAVALAYVDVWAAARQRELRTASVELRERSFQAAQARLDAGYGISTEVELAELAREEAALELALAESGVSDALAVLGRLTGLTGLDAGALEAPSIRLEGHAVAAQPVVRLSLQGAVEAATFDLRTQRLDLLPTVSLDARYNIGRSSVRAPDGTSWTVTLGLNWVLFDDARYARIDAARARAEAAALRLGAFDRVRAQETQQAERQLADARERLALRTQAVAVRERARDLVAEQFALGGTTIFELIGADDAVEQARSGQLQSALDVQRAAVVVLYLSGALDGRSLEVR